MRLRLASSTVVVAALLLAACSRGDGRPAGKEESRTYPLQGFDSLLAETGVEIILKQGPFAVEARSHNGDLSRLLVEVRGSKLSVSSQSLFTSGRQPTYTVTVSAPAIKSIEAAAGVALHSDSFTFEDLKLEGSTGVAMKLAGTCKQLDVQAAAGASIDAAGLKCASVNADGAAGGRIAVFASEKAHLKAVAGSVIELSGSPPTVEKEAELGGVIVNK